MSTPTRSEATQPVALVAAAVVAILVVVAVVLFGVVRPPQLAPLDGLSFTGTVAYLDWTDEACVIVVRPDGDRDEAWCGDDGGELVGWTDAGLQLRRWAATDRELLTIDPDSGEVVHRSDADGADFLDPHRGHDLAEVRDGGQLEVRVDGQVLWTTDADERYSIHGTWPSPDGAWVALQDSADRLLLVPADGSAEPVVWTEDVDGYATIVWRDVSAPDA